MGDYVLLTKLSVQNANAIAGLTYGFPAITNFLGFAHALSRKLPSRLNVSLGGVVVISHKNIIHARQPKGWGDYVFALTRNPLTQQGKTPPINEEGRMHMQVSLFIEIKGLITGDKKTEQTLITQLIQLIPSLRLAGGQITSMEQCQVLYEEESQQKALRRLMPGFVLRDRSDYLAEHFSSLKREQAEVSLFDAWCDFAKVKYKATPVASKSSARKQSNKEQVLNDVINKATWYYQAKPASTAETIAEAGNLVPIAAGYCAISPLYSAGEVPNIRDKNVPVVFVETAYSVGEWQSVYQLKNINEGVWRYTEKYPWYLAKSITTSINTSILEPDTLG